MLKWKIDLPRLYKYDLCPDLGPDFASVADFGFRFHYKTCWIFIDLNSAQSRPIFIFITLYIPRLKGKYKHIPLSTWI